MEQTTRFHNAFTSYYLELLLLMNSNLKYKGKMESFYKSRVTVRNTIRGLAHYLLNHMYFVENVHFSVNHGNCHSCRLNKADADVD